MKIYRGTSFKVLAKNFHGEIIENRSDSHHVNLFFTSQLELALKYAIDAKEKSGANLPLILEAEVPQKHIYKNFVHDPSKKDEYHSKEELFERAEEGEQVIIRRHKNGNDKWPTPFLKTKFLSKITEIDLEKKDVDGLYHNAKKININGRPKILKKYIKQR